MNYRAKTNGSSSTTDRRSDQKVPVVYFDLVTVPEQLGKPLRIKIGESGNHKKRNQDHSKSKFGVDFKVEHLCVVKGTRADEQQVLRYFFSHRLENEEETFWPHDELVDYIRWLRDQYYVWVPGCKQRQTVDELDMVDSSLWMPNAERRKQGPTDCLYRMFGELNLPPPEVTIDDFYTNEIIVEAARRSMRGIDLDPASHPVANWVVKAQRIYSKHDNGLLKDWSGRVWINPPFSEWQLWVPKIINEWNTGRVSAICLLCATRTLSAQYFAAIHENCTAVCVLHGRIPFWGERAASPDDGHAIFYFGNDIESFERAFGELGHIYFTRPQNVQVAMQYDALPSPPQVPGEV